MTKLSRKELLVLCEDNHIKNFKKLNMFDLCKILIENGIKKDNDGNQLVCRMYDRKKSPRKITYHAITTLVNKQTLKFELFKNGERMTFFHFYNDLDQKIFVDFLIQILSECEFEHYYFQMKPFNRKNWKKNELEFVLMDTNAFNKLKANPKPFISYFEDGNMVSFDGLGKINRLISPVPEKGIDKQIYLDLASFIRYAPIHQKRNLFLVLKDEIKNSDFNMIYINTHGIGIYWLHLRMDKTPKYYKYKEYR